VTPPDISNKPTPDRRAGNALRKCFASGKMPVILELHLTEADRLGYEKLRRRYLADAAALPRLTFLGQYLRQLDAAATDLDDAERSLTKKLQVYADLLNSGRVDLVALDDGARGRDSLDNAVAAELLVGLGVDPGRLLANIVARNRFAEQIKRRLLHFAELGVRNALLLTGDLPVETGKTAKFPVDSIGMCDLARAMQIRGELPEDFLIAAAGHPNPDVDPDGLHTFHKLLAGARVIITQAIYSLDEFTRWMDSLRGLGVLDTAHVLAEVIPMTSAKQLRAVANVPGIRVPPELIAEMEAAESRVHTTATAGSHDDAWVRQRLAQEAVRMTRGLLHGARRVQGVNGFYLGCVKSFDAHLELLKETPLLPERGHGPTRGAKLSGPDRQRVLAQRPNVETLVRKAIHESHASKGTIVAGLRRTLAGSAWTERALKILEWPKSPIFGCKQCDRCDLSPDALICPRECAKQMTHGPCGAPRLINGRYLCEDTSRECTWAAIRARREELGVPMSQRLEVREAPSAGFFEGKRYSAFLPVLRGEKASPDWNLAYRFPVWAARKALRQTSRSEFVGSPFELDLLVETKLGAMKQLLRDKPGMDAEELLLKALALVGTPAAVHLIETRMVELGLPAEGTVSELSIRELFLLSEAIPRLRDREPRRGTPATSSRPQTRTPLARTEDLLAVLPEGRELRRAIRRELANGMIRHIAALGVRVFYAEPLLEAAQVDSFLHALAVLKDELQLVRARLSDSAQRISVHFERLHYKLHYRAAVSLRRFLAADRSPMPCVELLIDLKQFGSAERFRGALRTTLEHLSAGGGESDGAIVLEDFAGESRSVCWALNAAFWQRLKDFESAAGINYDASIGGSTDHNLTYVRSTARAFMDRVHDLNVRDGALYVLEIGVASTTRAKAFLSELKRIGELTGSDAYDRTVYVLADYSQDILDRSAADLRAEHPRVEAVRIDVADPLHAMASYRDRILHIHLCNVFDNLPTDKVGWVDGELYHLESRLYVPHTEFEAWTKKHGMTESEVLEVKQHLSHLSHLSTEGERADGRHAVSAVLDWLKERMARAEGSPLAYVPPWMELVAMLRFEEQYVRADNIGSVEHLRLDLGGMAQQSAAAGGMAKRSAAMPNGAESEVNSQASPRISDLLRKQLQGDRDLQVHVNQEALRGFVQLLELLHPAGTLEVVDLFVQRTEEYHQRYKGPAKYDGTTVNWLNGPLFRAVAEDRGYEVRFNSFRPFDPKSSSVVMLASKVRQERSL